MDLNLVWPWPAWLFSEASSAVGEPSAGSTVCLYEPRRTPLYATKQVVARADIVIRSGTLGPHVALRDQALAYTQHLSYVPTISRGFASVSRL